MKNFWEQLDQEENYMQFNETDNHVILSEEQIQELLSYRQAKLQEFREYLEDA